MNGADRVVEAARVICDSVIPPGIEDDLKKSGRSVHREELFEITSQRGESALLVEIDSPFRRVKSFIIGKRGSNIRAILALCASVSKQEGYKIFDISVVKNG